MRIAKVVTCLALACAAFAQAPRPRIAVKEYQRKVLGSWLGQCVGNIYGLPHENRYIREPGPDRMPYGYLDLKRIRDANGAFSDDDTDFEYLYLIAMEKFGIELSYEDLARMWKEHVRDRVWLANRAALTAMHYGIAPPLTGMAPRNPHWFQIDPQLINEIWAVTAPGMVRYAVQKSDWAARITNEGWGVEATLHYAAMYAAAFHESDVARLIDLATAALPPTSRFAATVEHMKTLHRTYPSDWRKARAEMATLYYSEEPRETRSIWNANLNGAAGILALLYGKGDFRKTLDLSCAIGFDADNQAATMAGLLGLIHGPEGIPRDLLFPLADAGWTQPFNDLYKNVSRHGLPDARITDIARRMAAQGERVLLAHGGRKFTENGVEYLESNPEARFAAALSLPDDYPPVLEVGSPVEYRIPAAHASGRVVFRTAPGSLPPGLQLSGGSIRGKPSRAGVYRFTVHASEGKRTASRSFEWRVYGKNLAGSAAEVLAAVRSLDPGAIAKVGMDFASELLNPSVECIRDGKTAGPGTSFYSMLGKNAAGEQHFGYRWAAPQRLGYLVFHTGQMEGVTGWFSAAPVVEYLKDGREWTPVTGLKVSPSFPAGMQPFDKPHFCSYEFAFDPAEATAIRIRGLAAGNENPRFADRRWISVTELAAYSPQQ